MPLGILDWGIIAGFFIVSLGIGVWASRSAGKSSKEFFLGGRSMPWWLLGVSMVATTFSTDTPNLVAGLVRSDGVSGNWCWWGFLLSGMLTVFVFAKLWRRSEVLTDVEFYELRFSGKAAAFLRGFRSLYLGLVFNVLIMGAVSLAVVKFGETVLSIPGWQMLLAAGLVTLGYSSLGGLKGVIWTDFVQFILAMIGSFWAAYYIISLDAVGSISTLLNHSEVLPKSNIFPDFTDPSSWIPIILIPVAVTWWATYYPGAEPGGGGYIVQRMLSAKDEKNAIGATLFFNIAHYALRPWPWILIALASIILVPLKIDQDYTKGHLRPHEKTVAKIEAELNPASHAKMVETLTADLEKLKAGGNEEKIANAQRLHDIVSSNPDSIEIKALAYLCQVESTINLDGSCTPLAKESLVHMYLANDISVDKLGQDLGYPTMIKLLPTGLLGLVSASLIAAFMSTMSTQVNLGASYLVNDFYARFIHKDSSEKHLVMTGRLVTVLMICMGSGLGLILTDASQAFKLMLLIGAGTGPVYILRWFWWRVSAISEITAMVSALVISGFTTFYMERFVGAQFMKDHDWSIMLVAALLTTAIWIIVTILTKPTEEKTLLSFYQKVQPGGAGWKTIRQKAEDKGLELDPNSAGWDDIPYGILCTLFSSAGVYTALFATGEWIFGNVAPASCYTLISVVSFGLVMKFWKKLRMD
ncbi:sodium:solute symporter family protein [Persicirhabdus sediminis]|uniref:Na+:solute symporter n=1 Tax=Persicirhabdus sediminis TaxID=454144 RepID=A0A8J7MFC2_9BACT|nr:sodium:solute symporter family protein [Persicirhabdus sediminis]MBK1792396.1 Na+:solute symporter [Persicirhabdus sediminis]